MVKQYATGYFENGAWHRGNYEATQKFLEIVDVDLKPINNNFVLKVNGSEGGLEFGELTDVKSKCNDCPCITAASYDPSYGRLWIVGLGIVLIILAFVIAII